eukprot:7217769-Prymnesium_polylepis.1
MSDAESDAADGARSRTFSAGELSFNAGGGGAGAADGAAPASPMAGRSRQESGPAALDAVV